MQIEINTGEGVQRSAALDQHIQDKLAGVSRRFGDRLTRIRVHLKDVNADKGGIDKLCSMEARPAGRDPVGIEAQDDDAYRAVGDAAGKLERALEHRLDRD